MPASTNFQVGAYHLSTLPSMRSLKVDDDMVLFGEVIPRIVKVT